MPPDRRKYLYDIQQACRRVQRFTHPFLLPAGGAMLYTLN